MQELSLLLLLGLASIPAQAWAAVKVKGFAASGDAPGTLSIPGPNPNRYTVSFTSYLATPTTQAAENFAPLQWRARTITDDPTSQVTLDRSAIPAVVSTQLVNPWAAADAAVKGGFPGISVNDEERADVRPPNPSLCVGDAYVLQVSDMVIKVWDMAGKLLGGPVTLTDFFGSGGAQFGGGGGAQPSRFSDAFCVFDAADSGRFYISVLSYTLSGGVHLGSSELLLAVSRSGNPTEGFLGPYSVPTMGLDATEADRGVLHGLGGCRAPTPQLPAGCMATSPVIGLDQHGIWVGLNLYQTYTDSVGGNYTAPLLLGVSKRALLEGRRSAPAYAALSGWDADTSFGLAPSLTQGGSAHCVLNNGTLFVASSGPVMARAAAPASALLLWAVQNTSTLSHPAFPRIGLPSLNGSASVQSWQFADPTAAGVVVTQPDGGTALDQGDARLTQLSYSDGMLWTAASTAVLINRQGDPLDAAIWWALQFGWAGGKFAAKIASQGYVAVMGNHIVDPVIVGSAASGTPSGVLAGALVGPDYHMSPMWTPINMQLGAGAIHTPQLSKVALTGPPGDNQAGTLLHGRSAATADTNGLAWVTSEWAAGSTTQFCQNSQLLPYRTSCTNWGTQITAITIGAWP